MSDPVITTEIRTDTNNQSGWSTIVITRTNGVETQRVTTYDAGTTPTAGLVVTDTTENGFVVNRLSVDAGNNNSWTSIETNYVPGSTTVADRVTIYDNGTTKTETFSDGTLSEISRTGTVAAQGYDTQTTTYDLVNGGRTTVTTVGGQTTTDVYDAGGDLVSRTQIDGQGAESLADWASVVTTYTTENGVETVQRTYTYDTGLTRAETVVGGTIARVVLTDSNQASWSTITETYDAAGVMVSRIKVEDDGDTITETYVDGTLDSVVLVDVANGPQSAWQSMTRTYDPDGNLVAVEQVMDNGLTVSKTIGQRDVPGFDKDGNPVTKSIDYAIQTVTQDTATVDADTGRVGLKSWDTMTLNYGTDGNITSSTTVMDDTDTVVRTYAEGGVLSEVVKTDVDDSSSFDTITMTYDAEGKIASREILRDDDVTTKMDYGTDGKQTHSIVTDTTDLASPTTTSLTDAMDGQYKWTSIEKDFENGKVVSTTVIYDDTNTVTTTYDDTVIGDVIRTTTQTQTGGVLDGKEFWTDRVTTFVAGDADKPLWVESRITTTNLGRVTEVHNGTDGVRDSMVVTDEGAGPNGAFDWDKITTIYDANGNIESRQQVADSGDQTLRLYDANGDLTDVVLYDGDNSNSWVFRITTFDGDGKAVTENVDPLSLPTEYMSYFDGVPGLPII